LSDKESKEINTRKSEKGKKKDENQERTAHANRDGEAYGYLSMLLGNFTVILV
jgi:hypothetical protein